ncbi:MAG TPA: VOC family protein [Candidatus Limnocylindria bacterium]|nr:VOC family protein [Candidatus Limnocylindria bacterium]
MQRPDIILDTVTIDCLEKDVPALMDFYERLTGFHRDPAGGDEVPTLLGKGIAISFFPVNHYYPPTFPSPAVGRQMHLDFYVTDLPAAVAYALSIGARESPRQFHDSYRILFDPAGHPFCLTLNGPAGGG